MKAQIWQLTSADNSFINYVTSLQNDQQSIQDSVFSALTSAMFAGIPTKLLESFIGSGNEKAWWDPLGVFTGKDDRDEDNGSVRPTETDSTLFTKLVAAEAGGEDLLGQALVARSVLNRKSLISSGTVSPGTFLANNGSLEGVIMGSGQYQPISDGRINKEFGEAQLGMANEAIKIAIKHQ